MLHRKESAFFVVNQIKTCASKRKLAFIERMPGNNLKPSLAMYSNLLFIATLIYIYIKCTEIHHPT